MKIKLLTLNIWHGGKIFDPMLEFLKKESADIMTLQEVHESKDKTSRNDFHTTEVFKKELEYPYSVFDSQVRLSFEDIETEHGNATYSRFPIVETSNIFFDIPYGPVNHDEFLAKNDFTKVPQAYQKVKIKVGENVVTVINVHGIWGRDGKDNERRLAMSNKLLEAIKNEKNVIMAGDFNVEENTKTVGQIEEHLTNVFKGELKSTFNMKRKDEAGYATSVVDMILVSPNIKILSRYCPQVDISDHLPLVCELEL